MVIQIKNKTYEEIEKLAEKLKDYGFDAVVTSGFEAAVEEEVRTCADMEELLLSEGLIDTIVQDICYMNDSVIDSDYVTDKIKTYLE